MTEPAWLSGLDVLRYHGRLIERFGGPAGIRDAGLLESALARPRNLYAYGEPSLFHLAAAYAFGVAKNHPFVDGNKRTAAACIRTFLWKNGYVFSPSVDELVRYVEGVASSEIGQDELARWIRSNAVPR